MTADEARAVRIGDVLVCSDGERFTVAYRHFYGGGTVAFIPADARWWVSHRVCEVPL